MTNYQGNVAPFDRERDERRRPMLIAMLLVAVVFALGVALGLLIGLTR